MDQIVLKTFPKSHLEFLASTWLQQQDLNGKSPSEIADMYYKALAEVQEHYRQSRATQNKQPQQQNSKRVIRSGLFEGDW